MASPGQEGGRQRRGDSDRRRRIGAASTWAVQTTSKKFFERRVLPDMGSGPLALGAAILGWDFIYYWNHRFMHESRYMWAIHVVHHSSERYNL